MIQDDSRELALIEQLIGTASTLLKRIEAIETRLDELNESIEEIDDAIDWPVVYRRRSAQSKGDQPHED